MIPDISHIKNGTDRGNNRLFFLPADRPRGWDLQLHMTGMFPLEDRKVGGTSNSLGTLYFLISVILYPAFLTSNGNDRDCLIFYLKCIKPLLVCQGR